MPGLRIPLATVLIALLGACALTSAAPAADSLAPPGSAANWLPKEGWVWMHWLPFEEPELAAALGTTSAGIRAHLTDDTHTLATLAHRRHRSVRALARHLTRRFDGRVSRRRLALLRHRTERMLTQGHLSQHVLYHTLHGPAVPAHAPQLYGITREAFIAARQEGLSPADIAVRVGRDPALVRAGVLQLLRVHAARGVKTLSQTRAQARRMLARQAGDLDCWMARPLPKLDPLGHEGHELDAHIPGCNGLVAG